MSGVIGSLERVAELVALAWAVGLSVYTSLYFLLYLQGVALAAAVAPALIAALVVVGGVSVYRQRRWPEADSEPEQRGSALLLVVAALAIAAAQVVVAVRMALASQLQFWDAWFVWAVKARMFLADGPPAHYFTGALGPVAHPDYPLTLPLAEATLLRLPQPLGLDLASTVSALCFGALLLLFYVGSARLYGRTRAALATALLALVPSLPRWAGLGYADAPLALYSGAAALYLLLWWRQRREADLLLVGVMAGGAIWTKKEGLPVAALVLAALVLGEVVRRAPVRQRLRAIVRGVLPAVLVPLPWLIFTHTRHLVGTDFWPITPHVFRQHADRLPTILSLMGQELLSWSHWGPFWIVLVVVLVIAGLRRLSPSGWAILLLLLAQLGLYAVSFVFSYWTPYTAHIAMSLDRLIVHALPWAVLLLLEATRSLDPLALSSPGYRQRPTAGDETLVTGFGLPVR